MVATRLLVIAVVCGLVPGEARAAYTRWCDEPVVACRTAECGTLTGRARHRCLVTCRTRSNCSVPGAAVGTFAYVVNQCRQDPDGTFSFGERLMIRRGNRRPVTVMDFPLSPWGYDPYAPFGLCRIYGEARFGRYAQIVGFFQRIIVLPDGSGI